jgi:nicotinamidase-related amidase
MSMKPTNEPESPGFIRRWLDTLPDVQLTDIAPDPERTAVCSTDMINAFLREGAISSPRVNQLTGPVVDLIQRAWDYGVRYFAFTQDTHTEDNPEFQAYPPHAIANTSESDMITELARLPFADAFAVFEKNSLNPSIGTGFDAWWDKHRDLTTVIVTGNCTDLCVYQLAMHLRMRANALGIQGFSVIVPANAVQTFDIPETDDAPPGTAHPGDFFDDVFLYHMASNGIRVVRSIS